MPRGVFWLHMVISCYAHLMSNERRPAELDDIETCPECRDVLNTDGSCPACGTVRCDGCGAHVPARDAVEVIEATGKVSRYCRAHEESDGVPVEVEAEASGAQTVRLTDDPSIAESGRAWAEQLSKEAA